MPRLLTKPLLKLGVIAGIVALLALYIWWSMRVPPPRETDRVTHRDGVYSIVKPRDWEVSFNYAPGDRRYIDTLLIRFPTTRPRDFRIFVGRFRDPPDLQSIQARDRQIATQFQGKPAHVFTGRTRLEYYWRAVFQRGGDWYELVFWSPYEEDVPSSGWFAYLATFRTHDVPTTQPRDEHVRGSASIAIEVLADEVAIGLGNGAALEGAKRAGAVIIPTR